MSKKVAYSLVPAVYESGDDGQAVDLYNCSRTFDVLMTVVAAFAEVPIVMIIQQSDDGTTWTDIGQFNPITQGQEVSLLRSFTRTARYVRTRYFFEDGLSCNLSTHILADIVITDNVRITEETTVVPVSSDFSVMKVTLSRQSERSITLVASSGVVSRFRPEVTHSGVAVPTSGNLRVTKDLINENVFWITCSSGTGTITLVVD